MNCPHCGTIEGGPAMSASTVKACGGHTAAMRILTDTPIAAAAESNWRWVGEGRQTGGTGLKTAEWLAVHGAALSRGGG